MNLAIGDLVPWSEIPSTASLHHPFEQLTGHRIILFFFGSASSPEISAILHGFFDLQEQFQHWGITFLGVSINPSDRALASRVKSPSFNLLWDFKAELSRQFGVCYPSHGEPLGVGYQPTTFVLDEHRRVLGVFPLSPTTDHVKLVRNFVASPSLPQFAY